ncbi:Thyroid receptor-interacting protein 11 [Fukomys damarensis]|uniref:Thyroid receptor-interacting protein 11 n=1 Tax=Fukomys damarensis TaxID=885580 RepID=A0A091CUL1_FUKDA|nr:Thyroid receptor-interacting protein 11 [Fukomys damarensis]
MQPVAPSVPVGAGSAHAAAVPPSTSPGLHHRAAFYNNDMDFGDLVSSQQEINGLSNEISRLESEVGHWRHIAQAQAMHSPDQAKICRLQCVIKKVQEDRNQELDNHQNEIAVLQNLRENKPGEIKYQHGEEITKLGEEQLKTYTVQREHLLTDLSKKARENRLLKRKYNKVLEITAAKGAALTKLQEEKQLPARCESSGSDASRRTIQNLSRIIREKDLEVDALRWQSQTLWVILQMSSGAGDGVGDVNSAPVEQLLEELGKLKQQVNNAQEWKPQAMSAVWNLQQEQLQQPQSQALADSDAHTKLEVGSTALVSGQEQRESRPETLQWEWVRVQYGQGQRRDTQGLLSGKPHTPASSLSSASPEASQLLQPETEKQRRSLWGKGATVGARRREDRWSEAIAAAPGQERREREQTNVEVRPLKEKPKGLQDLPEENRVGTSRGKETEHQAEENTDMKHSVTL